MYYNKKNVVNMETTLDIYYGLRYNKRCGGGINDLLRGN
jgi:hypothetical protein